MKPVLTERCFTVSVSCSIPYLYTSPTSESNYHVQTVLCNISRGLRIHRMELPSVGTGGVSPSSPKADDLRIEHTSATGVRIAFDLVAKLYAESRSCLAACRSLRFSGTASSLALRSSTKSGCTASVHSQKITTVATSARTSSAHATAPEREPLFEFSR